MWFEIMLIPFFLIIVLFLIFTIVQEGSRWQKHRFLGRFARYIQASAGRAFFTFLLMTFMMIPATLGILQGHWWDLLAAGETAANTVPIVNTLLIMFLTLAAMIPVMWGSFRTWRQAVRSAAEVKVRTTAG
jgi:hypothetical protein